MTRKNPMFSVYILTNFTNKVLYIGVTNDLHRRLYEHKNGIIEGFTKKYHVHKLVYYETTDDINAAIHREKKLKGLLRSKKIDLINSKNPLWNDLGKDLFPDLFKNIF